MTDHDHTIRRRVLLAGIGAGAVGLAGCLDPGDDDDDGDDNTTDGDADDTGDTDGNTTDGDADGDEDGDSDDEDGDEEGASLAVTAVWTEGEQEDFQAVLEYVEEETGHSIEYQPRGTEELLTGTRMDYEAETTPADIVVIPSPARVTTDAAAGHLEDTSAIWDAASFATSPDPVTVDDGIYAAPFGMDLKPGFWYRQSFFEEHELEEPESYEDFLGLLDEIDGIDGVDAPLASGNGVGWPLSDVTEAYFLRQDDGASLQAGLISGDTAFANERVLQAFEEIKETLEAGYWSELREFGVQYEYFWENQTPLYFMGSWTPAFEAIQEPEDLGYFQLPGVESMVAAINWLTVPTYGDNVEAALEAVEAIVSAEGQRVWTERGGFVPTNEDVSGDAFEQDIMANLHAASGEMELVQDLDDSLGDPFQSEFWAQLLGLWSEPGTDLEGLIETLDDVHQETVAAAE